MYKIRDRLLTPGNKIVCRIARIESGATRGLLILVARLTARKHNRIFLLCHYFAIMKPVAENESRHLGQNEMSRDHRLSNPSAGEPANHREGKSGSGETSLVP